MFLLWLWVLENVSKPMKYFLYFSILPIVSSQSADKIPTPTIRPEIDLLYQSEVPLFSVCDGTAFYILQNSLESSRQFNNIRETKDWSFPVSLLPSP